ncbi:hypothetical protein CDAR_301751 [Caerostris darwini]|uniref:Uncharacterized protein n=1 Tax=Caerostris darwini TaxID=1538125 RepID=A0AAV4VDJ9_9ARAC|nr:hypothetical protein CDAR_301751 [Caerostris darwini]
MGDISDDIDFLMERVKHVDRGQTYKDFGNSTFTRERIVCSTLQGNVTTIEFIFYISLLEMGDIWEDIDIMERLRHVDRGQT